MSTTSQFLRLSLLHILVYMIERTFKDKELVAKQIGQNLRDLRKKKGLSQAKLAELADIDVSYVGFIENGTRNVTAYTVIRFARALNCKAGDLFKHIA